MADVVVVQVDDRRQAKPDYVATERGILQADVGQIFARVAGADPPYIRCFPPLPEFDYLTNVYEVTSRGERAAGE